MNLRHFFRIEPRWKMHCIWFGLRTIIWGVLLLASCNKDSVSPTPVVTAISENPISQGSSFTLSGTNFSATAEKNIVKFGDTDVTVSAATTTQIMASLSNDFPAGSYTVSVTVNGSTGVLAAKVNVTPKRPLVADFTPVYGFSGSSVIIAGDNFTANPADYIVKFGTVDAIVTAADVTSLTVTVPTLTPGTYPILVALSQNGETSEAVGFPINFTVIDVAITGISPASGTKGTELTITGTGFDEVWSNNLVKINGHAATVIKATPTQLNVIVPKGAGTGLVSLTANGKSVEGPVFTYQLSRNYIVSSTNLVASDPQLANVTSLAHDTLANMLYASTGDQSIKVIDISNGTVNTMTVGGLGLLNIGSIVYESGNIYTIVSTSPNKSIYKIVFNGLNGQASLVDIPLLDTQYRVLHGDLTSSNGKLYVIRLENHYPVYKDHVSAIDLSTNSISDIGSGYHIESIVHTIGGYFTVQDSFMLLSFSPTISVDVREATSDILGNPYWIRKYTGGVAMYDWQTKNLFPLVESNTYGGDIIAYYHNNQITIYYNRNNDNTIRSIVVDITMD